MHTRPSLVYYVEILTKFIDNPSDIHLSTLKRILKYVKGIIDLSLFYDKGQTTLDLYEYIDNDFVGDENNQKSTLGQVFFF